MENKKPMSICVYDFLDELKKHGIKGKFTMWMIMLGCALGITVSCLLFGTLIGAAFKYVWNF